MTRPRKKPVLVLNADQWTPLRRHDFNDVISNIVKGSYKIKVAVKGEFVQGPIRPDGTRYQIPWPVAVYVNRYVQIRFKDIAPTDADLASHMAILHRDQFTCQYCNEPAGTVDHVMPKSRGGGNTWLNLVAACSTCNAYKADRTPEEAGMKLIHDPFVPDHDPYRRDVKDVWEMLRTGIGVEIGDEDEYINS